MDSSNLKQWTADELLAELRRRERVAATKGAGGERSRAAPAPAPGRLNELESLPTADVAKLAQDRQRVIYGVDGRKDMYQVTSSKVRAAAKGVVALVKAGDLVRQEDGTYMLSTEPYRDAYDLCASEPFVSQPMGCFCSGFL